MPEFSANTIQLHIATRNCRDYDYLVLQRSDSLKVYPSLWQVVTGTIDPGEKSLETAMRELDEETAIVPETVYFLPYLTTFFDYKSDKVCAAPVFGVIAPSHDIVLSEEHQAALWLPYEECMDKLMLPSHRMGTQIFKDYILMAENRDMFAITHAI